MYINEGGTMNTRRRDLPVYINEGGTIHTRRRDLPMYINEGGTMNTQEGGIFLCTSMKEAHQLAHNILTVTSA